MAVDDHRGFERGEPVEVGAVAREKTVALTHGGFVSARLVCVAGVEREHEPVEEAPPRPGAFGEQAVLRGGQPDERQPFPKRRCARRRAIDSDDTAFGLCHKGASAEFDIAQPRTHAKPARTAVPRHLSQGTAAKAATRGQQRNRLEHIGLARPIVAGQHDEPGLRRDQGVGVGPEIGQREAGNRHGVLLARLLVAASNGIHSHRTDVETAD